MPVTRRSKRQPVGPIVLESDEDETVVTVPPPITNKSPSKCARHADEPDPASDDEASSSSDDEDDEVSGPPSKRARRTDDPDPASDDEPASLPTRIRANSGPMPKGAQLGSLRIENLNKMHLLALLQYASDVKVGDTSVTFPLIVDGTTVPFIIELDQPIRQKHLGPGCSLPAAAGYYSNLLKCTLVVAIPGGKSCVLSHRDDPDPARRFTLAWVPTAQVCANCVVSEPRHGTDPVRAIPPFPFAELVLTIELTGKAKWNQPIFTPQPFNADAQRVDSPQAFKFLTVRTQFTITVTGIRCKTKKGVAFALRLFGEPTTYIVASREDSIKALGVEAFSVDNSHNVDGLAAQELVTKYLGYKTNFIDEAVGAGGAVEGLPLGTVAMSIDYGSNKIWVACSGPIPIGKASTLAEAQREFGSDVREHTGPLSADTKTPCWVPELSAVYGTGQERVVRADPAPGNDDDEISAGPGVAAFTIQSVAPPFNLEGSYGETTTRIPKGQSAFFIICHTTVDPTRFGFCNLIPLPTEDSGPWKYYLTATIPTQFQLAGVGNYTTKTSAVVGGPCLIPSENAIQASAAQLEKIKNLEADNEKLQQTHGEIAEVLYDQGQYLAGQRDQMTSNIEKANRKLTAATEKVSKYKDQIPKKVTDRSDEQKKKLKELMNNLLRAQTELSTLQKIQRQLIDDKAIDAAAEAQKLLDADDDDE